MSDTVLILGATSAIARATAAAFAAKGNDLYLAARDKDELERTAADLQIRYGVKVSYGLFDAEAIETHEPFFQDVVQEMHGISGVVLAFGFLGDQLAARDFKTGAKIIANNFTGAASFLSICANYFEPLQFGFIIGITSVAGDRGRQSNYVYGAAKGALSLFLQGLRNRLFSSGVRVITVKPGFVDTAMTFGMPGLFLVASPEYVGNRIVGALNKSSDIIYLPWFWRYIMLIIKHIPEFIFKRMKL
ncbi:SDR family oxidoreductase [Sulfurirhabdus autotrophica]|uniref:Short-subunit dehydrogenase n=1 Tax=Sulfurirhabdus autotrophica TaxID=1706046 RepID=A0A4R3YDX5_9PROT|nr:SDR family oxidoreductase [Sulfurirhabdus autotrophica]TCV90101.1 short-subunit dehydrogenase [Sulfurirhabdus autotrophica]